MPERQHRTRPGQGSSGRDTYIEARDGLQVSSSCVGSTTTVALAHSHQDTGGYHQIHHLLLHLQCSSPQIFQPAHASSFLSCMLELRAHRAPIHQHHLLFSQHSKAGQKACPYRHQVQLGSLQLVCILQFLIIHHSTARASLCELRHQGPSWKTSTLQNPSAAFVRHGHEGFL